MLPTNKLFSVSRLLGWPVPCCCTTKSRLSSIIKAVVYIKKKRKKKAEISQQLLDDCPWNFLLVFRGTRAWKKDFDLLTFHLFCSVRGVSWKLEARLTQKTLIFFLVNSEMNASRMDCIDVCVSHRMNPGHISDSVGWWCRRSYSPGDGFSVIIIITC